MGSWMHGVRLVAPAVVFGLLTAVSYTQSGATPDRPSRGSWQFGPKKAWEISRAGNQSLSAPAELRVSPGGAFYVHDFDRQISYAYDRQGRFVREFAGQGQRPGEVSRYMNCLAGDQRVVVLSPESLHFYTSAGEYIRSVPNDLFARFPLLYLGGETFLFGPGALSQVRGAEAVIQRTDAATGETTEFARVPVSEEERQGPPGAMLLGLTPQILVARDSSDARIYYGKNSEYKIRAVSSDGKALATIELGRIRATVTEAEKRAHFAGGKMPAERIEKIVPMLPNRLAYYYRIEVHHGLVYVLPVVGFGRPLTQLPIDIFSRAGEYLYRGNLTIEGGKHVYGNPDNLRIEDDQLYVILEDTAGHRTIANYRIELPSK